MSRVFGASSDEQFGARCWEAMEAEIREEPGRFGKGRGALQP